MKDYVPLELVSAAAICVILGQRPIAGDNPRIFLSEQAETIANHAERIPGKIRTDTEPADISRHRSIVVTDSATGH